MLKKEIAVKKKNLLLAMFLCFLSVSVVFGNGDGTSLSESGTSAVLGDSDVADIEDTGSGVKADTTATASGTSKVDEAKEKANEEDTDDNANEEGLATLPDGPAYVGVYTDLKLRDGVWGTVLASLENNEKVTITGRDGDWYKVSTDKGDGYAHARYIFDAPDKRYRGNEVSDSSSGSSNNYTSGGTTDVVLNVSGDSVQGKVVSAAQQLVEKYSESGSFPYDPATNGGNLGCAQVVTTALKAAGVIDQTCLNCHGTIDLLSAAGWSSVTAPPYQAGDVIFWATYIAGTESHVGIVMTSGNTAQAMSNSSSQHKPRYHDAEYNGAYPVMRVMRKV